MTDPTPTHTAPEDAAFARFRRDGDPEALADVYDRLAPGLLRLAMKLLGDAAAAEDALQATFVTAIESAARHDGVRPVRAWLSGILANQVRNQRKRAGRRHDPERLPSERPAVDPHQDAVDAELQRALQRHVRELPDAWQAPILLRVRDGLTAGEIARALDRPAGTIRSQLARGLRRLRQGLAYALSALGLRLRDAPVAETTRAAHGPRPPLLRAALPGGVPLLGGLIMVPALLLVVSLIVFTPPSGSAAADPGALVAPPAAPAVAQRPADDAALLWTSAALTTRPRPLAMPAGFADAGSGMLRVLALGAAAGPRDELPDPLGPFPIVVLDADDAPVEGALVETWSDREAYDRGDEPLHQRFTDAQGTCELVLAGEQVFAVSEAGRVSFSFGRADIERLQWRTEGDTAAVELQTPSLLTGLVLGPDGRPLAGAEIVISPAGGGGQAGEQRTPKPLTSDADGRFEATLHPRVLWNVGARSGERRGPEWRFYGEPGSEHELELGVPGDWRIGGRVLDTQGRPVADAAVRVWRDLPDPGPGGDPFAGSQLTSWRRTARTDAEGRFEHRASALGGWLVQADVDGHAPGDVVSIELDGRRPSAQATLTLRASASIRGRVVDAEGAGMAGVHVRAHDLASRGNTRLGIQLPDHAERYGEARATSAADGSFVLDGLHPDGRFDVTALPHPTSAFAPRVDVADVQAGTTDLLLVVDALTARTARVHGRVLEARGGAAVPHFEIRLTTRRENSTMSSDREFHDPEGRFSMDDLVPGVEYALRVTAIEAEHETFEGVDWTMPKARADLAAVELPWFVARAEAPAEDVRLSRPGRVEVTVLDGHGAPVPLAQVSLRRDRDSHDFTYWRPKRSDDAGRVVFDGLPPGPWVFGGKGLVEQRVDVLAGGGVAVTLRP